MKILICLPTLRGREPYLVNCLQEYIERWPGFDGSLELRFSIERDAPSCGTGWNRCVEKATGNWEPDFIHFSNDDITVGDGWLKPLLEAVEHGGVPAPRIEPAGVQVGEFPIDRPPLVPHGFPPITTEHGYFYADLPENQPKDDWAVIDHGALPFCSWQQWQEIGPFIPIHFGTDKWFYRRAHQLGMPVFSRQSSVIYNYAPQIGRASGDWTEQDYLDFDLNIAYPMYEHGDLEVEEPCPLRNTPTGLAMAREWRRLNIR